MKSRENTILTPRHTLWIGWNSADWRDSWCMLFYGCGRPFVILCKEGGHNLVITVHVKIEYKFQIFSEWKYYMKSVNISISCGYFIKD